MNPAIVLVAPEHAADLTDEFGRYARDYDVLATTSVEEAEACLLYTSPSPRD